MLSGPDSKARSEAQGEIRRASVHAQHLRKWTKTKNFTLTHSWTSTKIANPLGANAANIGFQSELKNPRWNSVGELPCENPSQATWNTNPWIKSREHSPQSCQTGAGFPWPPVCAPFNCWLVGCWGKWLMHMAQGWLPRCRVESKIRLMQMVSAPDPRASSKIQSEIQCANVHAQNSIK